MRRETDEPREKLLQEIDDAIARIDRKRVEADGPAPDLDDELIEQQKLRAELENRNRP